MDDNNSSIEPAAPVEDELDIEAILDQWEAHTIPATVTLDPSAETPRTATFVFGSLGRIAYDKLIADYPPNDEQKAKARQLQLDRGVLPSKVQQLRWNPDTFPPALLAACSLKPKMTLSQAERLWNDPKRNDGELDRLFTAAQLANESAAQVRLGKGWEEILNSVSA